MTATESHYWQYHHTKVLDAHGSLAPSLWLLVCILGSENQAQKICSRCNLANLERSRQSPGFGRNSCVVGLRTPNPVRPEDPRGPRPPRRRARTIRRGGRPVSTPTRGLRGSPHLPFLEQGGGGGEGLYPLSPNKEVSSSLRLPIQRGGFTPVTETKASDRFEGRNEGWNPPLHRC